MTKPTPYTDEERAEAVRKVTEGLRAGTPLTVICSEDGMPCDDTVRDWGKDDPDGIGREIARAREVGFDKIALDAFAILEEQPERYATENGTRVDPGFVAHQKQRFEGRLKLLAKWDPKRYGDMVKLGDPFGGALPPASVAIFALPDNGRDT